MKYSIFCLVVLLAGTTLSAGCASPSPNAPATAVAADTDCARLETNIARAEESRRAGREMESTAWKAVVPVAVIARYANGKASAGTADRQVEALRAEHGRNNCDRHGG